MTSDPYMKWELYLSKKIYEMGIIIIFYCGVFFLSLCPVRIGMDAQDLKSEFSQVLEC